MEHTRLHDPRVRRDTGRTLVEGPHQVADAIAAGAVVSCLYVLESDHRGMSIADACRVAPTPVGEPVLAKLAGTRSPRGPIAVVAIPPSTPLGAAGDTDRDLVVLWGVSDPRNAGAIVRSAVAFGFDVAATRGTVDLWAPGVIRAAAATQFRTAISHLELDAVAVLAAAGYRTYATVATGGEPPDRADASPIAVLIGNEAHGLPGSVVAAAERLVTIDLDPGVESLNAAVAAGITLHGLRQITSRQP